MRALQHPFVAWLSGMPFRVLCSTCFLKCLNDACLELLLALIAAEVINVADLAYEEAGAFRVSSQKRCEYLLELLRMVSFEALAIDGLAMQAYIGACPCEIVLCSTCARRRCTCHGYVQRT